MIIGSSNRRSADATFRLRLLQTTDLHMHLLPFDYAAMAPSNRTGLANLMPTIEAFQADSVPTLLFDTGDFLQGSPLADQAMRDITGQQHIITQVFNALRYDAVAIGNHDFDYGVAALQSVAEAIKCPTLLANVTMADNDVQFAPTALLDVTLEPNLVIKIGVMGLCTPVVGLLDTEGQNVLTANDPFKSATQAVHDLKDQGAHVIVALCHFGIDPEDAVENIASQIAGIAGIDAVLAGHTHETFPSGSQHRLDIINPTDGTISGTPTVMAGAFGQHLGVIELTLTKTKSEIMVTGHEVSLVTPNVAIAPPPKSWANVTALHDETISHMSATIAETTLPFSTAFSLIEPDLTLYLLSCARQLHIEAIIAGTPDADCPILSTAAPFRTGSRSDPNDYITLPPGPITRLDVSAIYPFNNSPAALRRNGAQIKDWLEDAALLFQQVTPGHSLQPLIDPNVPPYRFDTIFGLTYEVDAAAPPGSRISKLRHKGIAVKDTDPFVLVTSSNRLSQGQNIPTKDIITIAQESSQEVLIQSLQRQSPVVVPCPHVWRFKDHTDTKAQFFTTTSADPTGVRRTLHDDGMTARGFRQFTLTFDT